MNQAPVPMDVPAIGYALKHISGDPPAIFALDDSGARVFARYVSCAQNGFDYGVRLAKIIGNDRLPTLVQSFFEKHSLYLLDENFWVNALGPDRRARHQEFKRSFERCDYLIKCLAQIFGERAISPPSPPTEMKPSPAGLEGLKRLSFSFARFFVSAITLHEPRRISSRSDVRDAIADTIVKSFSEIESVFFGLASAVSVSLNAKDDPILATILRDEDLFRKTFHADSNSEQYSLAQLEGLLLDG